MGGDEIEKGTKMCYFLANILFRLQISQLMRFGHRFMEEHDILTIDEVARYLRVSERTIYDWASKGSIPCGKLGTTWRFKRSDVERWIDEKLSGNVPDAPPENRTMRDVLSREHVTFLESTTKEAALTELAECLQEADEIEDADDLAKEIFIREELMSTGIGFNVAVPHVRLDTIRELVMAVGICRHAILDYASLDEQPVYIICMIAARHDQHAQYLKTLGMVSHLLKPAEFRQALREAESTDAVYELLTR